MLELRTFGIFDKVSLEECRKEIGKLTIGTRWVGIRTGNKERPEYGSRLVAQEIKNTKREDLFAATRPLEEKHILLSLAVSMKETRKGDQFEVHFSMLAEPTSMFWLEGVCTFSCRRKIGGKECVKNS